METNNITLQTIPKEVSVTPTDNFVFQLTPLQQRAFEIAKDHLKTSFDLSRSNGFVEWTKRTNTPVPK